MQCISSRRRVITLLGKTDTHHACVNSYAGSYNLCSCNASMTQSSWKGLLQCDGIPSGKTTGIIDKYTFTLQGYKIRGKGL